MKSLGYKHKSILYPILDEPESGKKPIQKSNKKIFELLFPLFIETIRKAVTDLILALLLKTLPLKKHSKNMDINNQKKTESV